MLPVLAESLSAPASDAAPAHTGRSRLARLGGIALLGISLLAKLKYAGAGASVLVSFLGYWWLWGWQFGLGFVALLFAHEMGHVIQLRREGIRASAPYFVPFLGAVVAMRERPQGALAEARVGLAGPVLGTAAVGVPALAWAATGGPLWQALTFTGCVLNLFNLAPFLPLDGGRAMAALTPWAWVVGGVGVLAATILWPSPLLVIVCVFGLFEAGTRLVTYLRGGRRDDERYYEVGRRGRLAVGAVYLGLVVLLAVASVLSYLPHPTA